MRSVDLSSYFVDFKKISIYNELNLGPRSSGTSKFSPGDKLIVRDKLKKKIVLRNIRQTSN